MATPIRLPDTGTVSDHEPVIVILQEQRVPIHIPTAASVSALKAAVRQSPQLGTLCDGKLLRLIAGGRILSDDSAPLSNYRIGPGSIVHAVLTDLVRPPGSTSAASAASAAIAAATQGGASAQHGPSGTIASAPPAGGEESAAATLRGFNRLAVLGLSPEEISMMRTLYLREVQQSFPPSALPLEPGESEGHRMLRAEEAWMAQQSPLTSEFAANLRPLVVAYHRAHGGQQGRGGLFGGPRGDHDEDDEEGGASGGGRRVNLLMTSAGEGTAGSAMMGFALGVLLGAAAMCWLCTATSRRFKQGITTGVMVNLALTLSGAFDRPGMGRGSASTTGGADGGSSGGVTPIEPAALVPIGPHATAGAGRLLRGALGQVGASVAASLARV